MSGYRGDGYGLHGDHGDEDFQEDFRSRSGDRMRRDRDDDDWRMRDDDWRMRDRERNDWRRRDDEGRGSFMFGRDDDRDRRWEQDRFRDRDREMSDRSGGRDRVESWVRDHNEDPYSAGRHDGGRDRDRDPNRGEGFLERAGHRMQDWMRDDDDDSRRRSRSPMGLDDRSRRGGGLGMDADRKRSSGNDPHAHYRSWRDRQLAELDRDYDEYCRENERKFSSEFESWRQNRRQQESGAADSMSGAQGSASARTSSSPSTGAMAGSTASGDKITATGSAADPTERGVDSGSSGDTRSGKPKR